MDTGQIILTAVAIAIGIASGYYGSKWYYFKGKLSRIRDCIDAVDEAVKDDAVTEEEFHKAWNACYKIFSKYLVK